MPVAYLLTILPLILLLLLVAMLVAAARGWLISFALLSLDAVLIYFVLAKPLAASDDRLGLGPLIGPALLVGFILAAIVGSIILTLRVAKAHDMRPDAIVAALAGGLFVLILLFGYGIFSRWDGALVFLLLGTVTLVSAQQAAFPSRKAWGPHPPVHYRPISAALAASVGGSILLGYLMATIAADQAKAIAQGRPHCIQSGHHTADGLLDVSLLTFRQRYYSGEGPLFLSNHGLLVIDAADGQKILNWSYRNLTFLPDSLAIHPNPSARPTIVCVPKQ